MEVNKVFHGDCLELHKNIESESVDLIITDLPYGNMGMENTNHGLTGKVDWDTVIEPKQIFNIVDRILRKNGKVVLFSQEPYTTRLINESISNVPFSYRAIWEKDHFANALNAKKAMVSFYEDILIFSKNSPKVDFEKTNPLRVIMEKYVQRYGKEYIVELFKNEGRYTNEKSARVHASYKFAFNKGFRVDLMTRDLYKYLSDYIDFEESYEELSEVYNSHHDTLKNNLNEQYPSVFNLWEGCRYKSNILKYKKDYEGLHPTQKPVLLLEDLIKTFSDEGDLVVDLTSGSSSTAIACINSNRNYICIEKDKKFYDISLKRIEMAVKSKVC